MGTVLGQRIKILLVIALGIAALWFIYAIRGILAPFVLAFILAYILTPLVDRMEAGGLKRTPSILLIFFAIAGGLALLVITAGRQMTGEVVELSAEFLRPQSTQAQITLANGSRQVWPVEASTSAGAEENPFILVEPEGGRVLLDPGKKRTFVLRFQPAEARRVYEGSLNLKVEGVLEGVGYSIPLRGNGMDETVFWQKEYSEAGEWGKLGLSARGLDFGMAGPNAISRIGALVAQLEPYVKPFVGPHLDLAAASQTYGRQLIDVMLGGTAELLSGVVSGIMLIAIVPFVAFFYLKEGRRITHGLVELVPNEYFEMTLNLLHSINNAIGGYIRGQLLAVGIVALLSVTGLALLEMPYALPVGVVAGLANMIPYLGPLIGIISASIVALATTSGTAIVTKVILLFLVIQVIDNILIQPIVIAKSVDLHPLIVMVVVMIGSDLWGIVGMLIAVPATGILKVSVQTIYEGLKGYRTS